MDELHKLTQMAEEIFGLDVFCTGKQMHKQEVNLSGKGIGKFLCPFLTQLWKALFCKVVPLISKSFH